MTPEDQELRDLNSRLKLLNDLWNDLRESLRDLAAKWKRADLQHRNTYVDWYVDLGPEYREDGDLLTVAIRFGQVELRKNDPIGHISVRFKRETSFGLDSIMVLYKVEGSAISPAEIIRVDDQQVVSVSERDILETIRLNLLNPKVLPFRIRAAIADMNASGSHI